MNHIKLDIVDLLNLVITLDNKFTIPNINLSFQEITLIVKDNDKNTKVLYNCLNKLGYSSDFINKLSYSISNCLFSNRWLIIIFYVKNDPDIFEIPKNINNNISSLYTDVKTFIKYCNSSLKMD